jgi:uncharacterized membrane protein
MVSRLSCILFTALLIGVAWVSLRDLAAMPERVAIHFGANGAADGWITHTGYRSFILAFVIGVPVVLVGLMAGLPRLTNGAGQIPHSAYWFAPERRQMTLAFLTRHSCWLGCLTIAATYGVHVTILRANAVSPPAPDDERLFTMLIVYVLGLVWWTTTLIRRFHNSGK